MFITLGQSNNLNIGAYKCFTSKNYACAQKAADNALALNSTDEARILQRNAEMALIEVKRNLLEKKRNKEKADSMIVQARQCLAKKQYDCAIAKSESALNLLNPKSATFPLL